MFIQENVFSNNNETEKFETIIAMVDERKQMIGDHKRDAKKRGRNKN